MWCGLFGIGWHPLHYSTESRPGRHYWTRAENEELIICYYAVRPSIYGFRRRLHDLWQERNSDNIVYSTFNEQRLCGQARSLLQHKYFTDAELGRLQLWAQGALNNISVVSGPTNQLADIQVVEDVVLNQSDNNLLPHEPRQHVVLTEFQCELFDRVSMCMNNFSNCERVYLPPLKGKPFPNLKSIMDSMNVALSRVSVSSLTELCNLCYCAA